jgi:hypothetical protein
VGVPPVGWHVSLGEHDWPLGHVPQFSVLPHPSGMLPQFFPCAEHVVGVHAWETHTLFVHVALTGHVPQLSVPPHPSGMLPQFFPCAAHVVGVQPPPVWHVPLVQVSPTGHEHVI